MIRLLVDPLNETLCLRIKVEYYKNKKKFNQFIKSNLLHLKESDVDYFEGGRMFM